MKKRQKNPEMQNTTLFFLVQKCIQSRLIDDGFSFNVDKHLFAIKPRICKLAYI